MWETALLCVTDVLSLIVVVRLLTLRLHRVYSVFCFFVMFNLANSSGGWLNEKLPHPVEDYRLLWMFFAAIGWVAILWMVYGLLQALLDTLPGILRFSRKLLNIIISGAVIITLLTARPEFGALQRSEIPFVDFSLDIAFILERVITTVALIVLLCILAFVLWFPVRIPRNLVVFSFSYIGYFGAHTGLLLMRDLSHSFDPYYLSMADGILLSCCFFFITVAVRKSGEAVPLRIGHRWEPSQQQKLVQQLEAMNASLLKGAPRV